MKESSKKNTNRKWSEEEASAWIGLVQAQQTLIDKVEVELKKEGFPSLGWYDVLWELERTRQRYNCRNNSGRKKAKEKNVACL